jgi:ATP-dependent Clp protease ATP-binding subunit ClpA
MLRFKLYILLQQPSDSDDCFSGEALFFPELTAYETSAADVCELLVENVTALLSDLPNQSIWQRTFEGDPEPFTVEVEVKPGEHSASWRQPLVMSFSAVRWPQSDEFTVVSIPALGIEVFANRPEELPRLLAEQIRTELRRRRTIYSLRETVFLSRASRLSVRTVEVEHELTGLREQAQRATQLPVGSEPVMEAVSDAVAGESVQRTWCRESDVARLAEVLGGRVGRSVLLVGASGVGKSAIFREVASNRERLGLGVWQFRTTSGSRLVSGTAGGAGWRERVDQLRQEAVRDCVILNLGSLIELMECGRSSCDSQGIAAFMRPSIARGEILTVVECSPEQLSLVERQDPGMLRAFVQLSIEEPPESDRLRILRLAAGSGLEGRGVVFSEESLAEIERLHRRFATYSAFPSRPLRFLRNLQRDHEGAGGCARSVSARDVALAFARETGLPLWILDDIEPLDMVAARTWFSERVLGQPEPVELIVNLLATLKVQLNSERRPLASFLFIGPTGVGKTEMAKSLADYLFGGGGAGESRMIRIDMSEYADADAVQRLIGGAFSSEGILTAAVRQQPFSLVLLDEFEKADRSFFDLLLQILGEGRLTDAAGRTADFRNAVIVMTSNLGAAEYGRGSVGFGDSAPDQVAAGEHFARAVRGFVRPELYNRIDRIVPFCGFDRTLALRVVEKQLELLRQRDGVKYRRLNFRITEGVVEYLLERGFEPRYGARSLKRVLERELLVPLAERLNEYAAETPLDVEFRAEFETTVEGDAGESRSRLTVTVRGRTDASVRMSDGVGRDSSFSEAVVQLQDLRYQMQRLRSSSAVLSLENRHYRLEQSPRRRQRRQNRAPAEDLLQRSERERIGLWLGSCEQLLGQITASETEQQLLLYGSGPVSQESAVAVRTLIAESRQKTTQLLLNLLDLQTADSGCVRIMLVSEDAAAMQLLASAYAYTAGLLSASIDAWRFQPCGSRRGAVSEEDWTLTRLLWRSISGSNSGQPETWELCMRRNVEGDFGLPLLHRQRFPGPLELTEEGLEGVLGIYLELRAPGIFNRLCREEGIHRFQLRGRKVDVQVLTRLPSIQEYLPPRAMTRRRPVLTQTRCRDYQLDQERVIDREIPEAIECWEGRLPEVLSQLLLRRQLQAAQALIE